MRLITNKEIKILQDQYVMKYESKKCYRHAIKFYPTLIR